jgi:hypothetical protein
MFLMAVAAIILLAPPTTEGAEGNVNCDAGQPIQRVIDKASAVERQLVLNISATCYEDLRITNIDFEVLSDGETTINGQISVEGLRGSLSDFNVCGHIRVFNVAGIRMLMSKAALGGGTLVHDNHNHGIDGNFHSSVLLRDLVMVQIPTPPLVANAFQHVVVDVPDAVALVFCLEQFSTAMVWRYRIRILVNVD